MAENQAADQPAEGGENQPTFNIQKLYIKELSLEIPHAPQIFIGLKDPQFNVDIHNEHTQLDGDNYEVTLSVTAKAEVEGKVVFLVEEKHSGIFLIRNIPQEHFDMIIEGTCPNIIFPYMREVVSDITVRAGFPPLLLSPVNFELFYAQKVEREKNEKAEAAA